MKEKDTYKDENIREDNLPKTLRVTPFSIPENFFGDQQVSILSQINIQVSDAIEHVVPEWYFESLEDRILSKISSENLKNQVSEPGFIAPDTYFETLENSIFAKISEGKLQDKVAEAGYTIPTDFFSNQENEITIRIAESNLKVNAKDTGYSVPEQYFENAYEDIIVETITMQWKKNIIGDGFNVPDHYFDALTADINRATIAYEDNKHTPRVIPLPKSKDWLNYISAAAVLLIISIGSYFALQEKNVNQAVNIAKTNTTKVDLHDVSDDEILNYLAQVSEDEELIHLTKFVDKEEIDHKHIDKTIDDEDIKEYLNYML